ncbi:MAG: VanZ family protein [Patescibacteria group bacterium]
MKLNKQAKNQIIYFLLAVLWGCLIFYLSSQPDLKSGLPSAWDFILRKLAHLTVFAILAFLLAASFTKKSKPYLLFVILAAIMYAFTDELHQLSVPGRVGSIRDIFIDSFGVGLGIYFFERLHLFKIFRKR